MAIMIPNKPLDYAPDSKEDSVFYKLSQIDKDIYVCHSLKINNYIKRRYINEVEIDFLVLIPNVGSLIIESKAGQIRPGTALGNTNDYSWYLSTGEQMKYNGPFRQAEHAMYGLKSYLSTNEEAKKYKFDEKMSLICCVALPTIDKATINTWILPPEAGDKELILCKNDFDLPSDKLYEKILKIIEIGKTKYDGKSNMLLTKNDLELSKDEIWKKIQKHKEMDEKNPKNPFCCLNWL